MGQVMGQMPNDDAHAAFINQESGGIDHEAIMGGVSDDIDHDSMMNSDSQ